ncbi:MAG TPA: TonB-dependent receptor, partial [Chitinophagaceae bacterium]|nr:TonB-dependent receptor [Chitinophagaceae bacterium]
MRRSFTYLVLIAFTMLNALSVVAQNVITISGSVVNGKTKEKLPAVSVSIKGSTTGTFTDDDGNFKFTTSQKLPLTLVITSIGYATKEVTVASDKTPVSVELETSFLIGQDVVVAASRTPERILESPVSIERVGPAAIRNAPAASYYDLVGNLKGVDVVTSSLTFKTPTTRGFSGSGNLRMNQFVDGMDNQAPGLNFSVGGFIGLTELDVESMELLPGASSALYGTGGMNGTLLINSKSPFKYQGLSFQVKQGVMHVDRAQRNTSPFHDWSVRWGKKVSEKFAFKIGAQFIQARDWIANDERNFLRPPFSANQNGEVKAGNRGSDPNYDGVNVYGDETTQNLNTIYASVLSSVPGALLGASNAFLNAQPNATIAQYNAFLTSIGAGALVNGGLSPILYGGHPTKNYFNGVDVSRTGYSEVNVISPTTVNIRLQGGLYYKIKENLELSGVAFWGTGNTVYTGLDRYALQNLKMGQYKLELKGKDFFVRGYTIQENSGESFNATIVSRLFNERWKPSQTWYPQYMSAYATALASGVPSVAAHQGARAFADQGRPTGNIYETQTFRNIANTPISRGGGLFLDRSDLYVAEAQYNLTNLLGLKDKGTDILVGGNFRQFQLNSQGTLFADTAGAIKINEYGFYGQVQQKLFKDRLKLSVSGRYDKNENFEGRFTPRVSAVVKVAENHNVRMSYQTAYRFPSTQNQWINLVVGGGTYLIGGLPQLRQFYN